MLPPGLECLEGVPLAGVRGREGGDGFFRSLPLAMRSSSTCRLEACFSASSSTSIEIRARGRSARACSVQADQASWFSSARRSVTACVFFFAVLNTWLEGSPLGPTLR